MGNGQIFYSAHIYKKDLTMSYMIENENEAFSDNKNLIDFPLHLAFASRGSFKNIKLLNVY